MSDTRSISYYSTCENCGTVLEGVGEHDKESNTLYGNPCPKCGNDFIVSGWLDDDDE